MPPTGPINDNRQYFPADTRDATLRGMAADDLPEPGNGCLQAPFGQGDTDDFSGHGCSCQNDGNDPPPRAPTAGYRSGEESDSAGEENRSYLAAAHAQTTVNDVRVAVVMRERKN